MPIYTYHCENCEHEFEKYQSFSEDALTTCPKCKKKALRKVYKPALVLFKGSGYYVTDNKGAHSSLNSTSTASSDNGSGDKDEKKTEKSEKKETKKAKAKEE